MTLTTYQERKIIALYKKGLSRSEIASVVGCSPDRVGYVTKKFGLPRKFKKKGGEFHNRSKMNDYEIIRMLIEYEAGSPVRDLAIKYGLHASHIYDIINGKKRHSPRIDVVRKRLTIRDDRRRRRRRSIKKKIKTNINYSAFSNESGEVKNENQ